MVRATCMRCGRSFVLTAQQIVMAVEESRGTKRKYYVVDCPFCHQGAKVPLRPIRQAYTRMKALGTLPETTGEDAAHEEPSEAGAGDASTQGEA